MMEIRVNGAGQAVGPERRVAVPYDPPVQLQGVRADAEDGARERLVSAHEVGVTTEG